MRGEGGGAEGRGGGGGLGWSWACVSDIKKSLPQMHSFPRIAVCKFLIIDHVSRNLSPIPPKNLVTCYAENIVFHNKLH